MICLFLLTGSVTDKPPGPPNSGRKGELSPVVGLHECERMKEIEAVHKFKTSFGMIFFPPFDLYKVHICEEPKGTRLMFNLKRIYI